MKRLIANSLILGSILGAFLVAPSFAQNNATVDAELDTDVNSIFVFNRVCYTQLPALQGIRNMAAQLAWEPLAGDKLENFRTGDTLEELEAWEVSIGQRGFQLSVSQGPLNGALLKTFPDFKTGKATTCTLVLDGTDPADVFLKELGKLAGKEPTSRDVADEEGGLFTTTWAGGNADVKVFLIGKTDQESQGNLISMILVTRE